MKEKLVEMAYHNAKLVLRQDKERIKREEGRTIGAVKEIEALLGLSGIQRMEAYDISNISGFQSVGLWWCTKKESQSAAITESLKSKSVQGPNDYASMEEVLTRRFVHGMD